MTDWYTVIPLCGHALKIQSPSATDPEGFVAHYYKTKFLHTPLAPTFNELLCLRCAVDGINVDGVCVR